MIELNWGIFSPSNNSFYKFVFTYIKMSKDSSAKYYQNYKKRLQKNLWKIPKSF